MLTRQELKMIFNQDDLKNILTQWYTDSNLSTNEIENKFKDDYDLNVSHNVVYLLLKEFSIPVRDISDSVSLTARTLDYSLNVFEDDPATKEVIDGLLISDGTISSSEGQKYHRFSISSSQKEFMNYCASKLRPFNPSENNSRKALGMSRNKGYEKSRHGFYTSHHPLFTKERIRWYQGGTKIVPRDIKLTALMVKVWYYGDGSIVTDKTSNTCIVRLSTDGFSKSDVDFLVGELDRQLGIYAVNSENRIRLKSKSIPTFFNLIGRTSDIDCYSYKFDVDEWRFWLSMKDTAKRIVIPYNRLNHLVGTNSVAHNRSPGGKKVMFTPSQVDKLVSLHKSGLLESDPRKNSASVTKNSFSKSPSVEKEYKKVFRDGFPYVSLSDAETIIMFNRLRNVPSITVDGREIKASYLDNDLAINFHPHLFHVKTGSKKTPFESFNEKSSLIDIVDYLVKKNADRSARNIRYHICRSKNTKRTSVFPVRVAKTLYYLYGKDNMKVLDPCAGYSSRLLGFYSCARGGTYEGIEPCQRTFDGLLETQKKIEPMAENHTAHLYKGCAESYMAELDGKYDIIFTSPPYFDLEKYSDEKSQSYISYPKYEEWLDGFLFPLIRESHRLLADDGVFLLNVADCNNYKIVEHCEMFLKTLFRIDEVLLMVSPSKFEDVFAEPIFVLRKH